MQSDAMAAFVHGSTQLICCLEVSLEQIELIDSVYADALVFDRNLQQQLCLAQIACLDIYKNHALLMRELDCIWQQVDQHLLYTTFVQLANLLLNIETKMQLQVFSTCLALKYCHCLSYQWLDIVYSFYSLEFVLLYEITI